MVASQEQGICFVFWKLSFFFFLDKTAYGVLLRCCPQSLHPGYWQLPGQTFPREQPGHSEGQKKALDRGSCRADHAWDWRVAFSPPAPLLGLSLQVLDHTLSAVAPVTVSGGGWRTVPLEPPRRPAHSKRPRPGPAQEHRELHGTHQTRDQGNPSPFSGQDMPYFAESILRVTEDGLLVLSEGQMHLFSRPHQPRRAVIHVFVKGKKKKGRK